MNNFTLVQHLSPAAIWWVLTTGGSANRLLVIETKVIYIRYILCPCHPVLLQSVVYGENALRGEKKAAKCNWENLGSATVRGSGHFPSQLQPLFISVSAKLGVVKELFTMSIQWNCTERVILSACCLTSVRLGFGRNIQMLMSVDVDS